LAGVLLRVGDNGLRNEAEVSGGMRDAYGYSLAVSSPEPEAAFVERLRALLPEFQWRGGDSDMQGPYQSGRSAEGASLKIWFGERPFSVSLSFAGIPKDRENREALKRDLIQHICSKLSETGVLSADQ
jgi:hypothetical protein